MEVYQYKIQPVDWVDGNTKELHTVSLKRKTLMLGVTYSRNPNNITAIRIQCQACPWNVNSMSK